MPYVILMRGDAHEEWSNFFEKYRLGFKKLTFIRICCDVVTEFIHKLFTNMPEFEKMLMKKKIDCVIEKYVKSYKDMMPTVKEYFQICVRQYFKSATERGKSRNHYT